MKDMPGDTSRNLITTRSNGTGIFRHYSTWTAAEQKAAIKACGLSPSKFGNKAQRNAVLFHLEKTLLPTDPGEVLRTLNERNICHLAVKSRQQLTYLLLQHMAVGRRIDPGSGLLSGLVRPLMSWRYFILTPYFFEKYRNVNPFVVSHLSRSPTGSPVPSSSVDHVTGVLPFIIWNISSHFSMYRSVSDTSWTRIFAS